MKTKRTKGRKVGAAHTVIEGEILEPTNDGFDRKKIVEDVCARVCAGESVLFILREDGMPNESTFYKWLREDEQLSQNYARAREYQQDAFSEQLIVISDDKTIDVDRARVMIDTRKWVMGRLKPKVYGDKIQFESKHTMKLEDLREGLTYEEALLQHKRLMESVR